MNREKYVFHLEKWIFEPIGNFAHTAEFSTLITLTRLYPNTNNANIN